MAKGILEDKTYAFAVRIVKLRNIINTRTRIQPNAEQLLRCGTSVGANVVEAFSSISDKEFISKLYISLKEAKETAYWINLLHDTGYLSDTEFLSINKDCNDIIGLLVHTIKCKKGLSQRNSIPSKKE